MPKVKNPLLSMEARGGIAGLVYNTWRGINTVKVNTSPTGQGTPLRLAAQARLIQASQLWRGLTEVQRAAWRQYAIDHPVADWTGSPKRLTGQNWFVGCAVQLLRQADTPSNTPPSTAAPDAIVGISPSFTAGNLAVSWTLPITGALTIEFWVVGPLSAGIAAKIEQTKFSARGAASVTQPLTLVTTPGIGRWTVFGRVIDDDNGLVSTWQSDYVQVT